MKHDNEVVTICLK